MSATDDKQRRTASLADYVEVDTSDERVSRLWDRVSTELEATNLKRGHTPAHGSANVRGANVRGANARGANARGADELRSNTGRIAWAAFAFAATVAIGLGAHSVWQKSDPLAGSVALAPLELATLETSSDSLAVDLQDGSRMELSAHSRLSVQRQEADELRLKLDQGKVECDVTHNPKRQFFVQAAGVVVRVTGTRFSVDVKNEEATSGSVAQVVEVSVSRGSVEIQRIDGTMPVRRLTAGERWSMRTSDGPSPGTDTVSGELATTDVNERHTIGQGVRPAHKPATVAPTEPEDAKALLEKGRVARRQGDPKAAANAYQQLLSSYPNDSRAGLAAFELGRLRMDRLGDMRGAVQALNQAVQLSPSGNVREDAMARLVDVYHRMGQTQNCVNARNAYLSAFPSGVHAATVGLRCNAGQ
jgi:ferric-dicitrate binding protein FerR (iron transport regulator)